ncbi:MAG: hypothetical protein LC733_02910 [Actinobacteria bacterium]|nr:hypothetical protein [Actinomycetota bacterium]
MSTEPEDAGPRPSSDVRRWLPLMGLVVGVWGMLPRYVSPELNTSDRVEFADHVVPGILVVAVSLVMLLMRGRKAENGQSMLPLLAGMAVLLAGFWMMATHLPLVAQALRDEAPWTGTIYHTSSSLAVFGLGLLWVTAHWGDLADAEPAVADPADQP